MVEPFHLVWVNFSKGEGTSFLFITLGSYRAEGPGGDGCSQTPLEPLCRMTPLDQPASWQRPPPAGNPPLSRGGGVDLQPPSAALSAGPTSVLVNPRVDVASLLLIWETTFEAT